MVIHACPVEDLSLLLSELGDVISLTDKVDAPQHTSLVRDAKLYAFLRCTEVLRAVLQSIHDENDFDEEDRKHEAAEPESVITNLCSLGVLDEHQAARFINQLRLAVFFSVDREWLSDYQEDLELFDKGVEDIPLYYNDMCDFLGEITDKLELLEDEEGADEDVH